MMDTILNLGLNDATVAGLAKLTANERFAWDAYRRFVMMYSNVVLGIGKEHFEEEIDAAKKSLGVATDAEIDANSWRRLVDRFKAIVNEETGGDFPQDVHDQLQGRNRSGLRFLELQSAPSTIVASTRSRTTGARPST